MPTIPIFIPDDLHKKFRSKLFEDNQRTAKEFFLTKIQEYAGNQQEEPEKKNEVDQNSSPGSEIHRLKPVKKPSRKIKKSIAKIKKSEEKENAETKGENTGGEGGDRGEGVAGPAGQKGTTGQGPGEPGPKKRRRFFDFFDR